MSEDEKPQRAKKGRAHGQKDRTKYQREYYEKRIRLYVDRLEFHPKLVEAWELYTGPLNLGDFLAMLATPAVNEYIEKERAKLAAQENPNAFVR